MFIYRHYDRSRRRRKTLSVMKLETLPVALVVTDTALALESFLWGSTEIADRL